MSPGLQSDKSDVIMDGKSIADELEKQIDFTVPCAATPAAFATAKSSPLAKRPEAAPFDEPTSALDPELVGEAPRVMRSLAEEDRTMLAVAHEMGFARVAPDRVVFLHPGLVEAEGPPTKLVGGPEVGALRRLIGEGTPPGGVPRFDQCCQWPGCQTQRRPSNT
ncbi:MAG: hypothetical protein ACLPN5_21820 [Roseiarcus sp.]